MGKLSFVINGSVFWFHDILFPFIWELKRNEFIQGGEVLRLFSYEYKEKPPAMQMYLRIALDCICY